MVVPLAFGWRHLLFANWPVDSDVLASHLPDELSVDEYGRNGWLSIIPLLNIRTRPRGLPASTGIRLRELNLRTYVTAGSEPGIYFFSLDAHGLLSVLGARLTHFLPYYYACIRLGRKDERIRFSCRRVQPGDRPMRFAASYRPSGDPFKAEPGSLAEFLTERRRLYTQDPSGRLRYTDVSHDRWTLYSAEVSIAENTLFEANGFDQPDEKPTFYYSPGVNVVTTRSRRWE